MLKIGMLLLKRTAMRRAKLWNTSLSLKKSKTYNE